MSERWDSLGPSTTQEFFLSVELYLSTAAALALPKPVPRKRREKPELSASAQPEERKVKEKSSWLTLSKGLPEGPWWPATCKFSGEGERCLLNIYLDKNRLYQTVYIHLINQTDIRQADLSLLNKKDCLSIYCVGGQRWTSNLTAEPIYLHFPSSETCNTWLALLRSFAVPEIHGRLLFPNDGGSHRMWRQLELTVVQGRGLGTVKFLENGSPGDVGESDDFTVSCEVQLNGIICGHTSEKRGIGCPDWLENFTFSDLPPFDFLVLLVRRDKKMMKTTTVGSISIPLAHFRRGELVEGWFPVLHRGLAASDFQVGELRLKIFVNEEIILPQTAYVSLFQTLNSRNFLDWIDDFENKLKMKNVSQHLMSLAIDRDMVVTHVEELAAREINAASPAQNTLFRGNTTLSRVMELCMNWYGKTFLEASVGGVIRKLCREKVAIEVDPARRSKGLKDIERNFELLTTWCQEFLDQIYAVRTECPQELRRLFEILRVLVEKRFGSELSKESHKDMQYRCVTAFCFLRFIVPAILNPHLFGFHLGIPPPQVHRSLTLIAKVLQSLANLNTATTASFKEEYMRGMAGFIAESTPAMIEYIVVVSTVDKDLHNHQVSNNKREQLEIETYLRRRSLTMQVLDKEAIPRLPDLVDIPRHLAVITSAVIRHSAELQARPKPLDPADQKLGEIYSKCLDVEEQALLRVSQLKARTSGHQITFPLSPNSHRPRSHIRPSTAPSPINSDSPFGRPFSIAVHNPDPPGSQHACVHLTSTSTDSIPSYGLSSQLIDTDLTSRRVRELFNLKSILRR